MIYSLLFLLASVSFAEQVTLDISPGGGSCSHIAVKDENGATVSVTSISDLKAQLKVDDCSLACQAKTVILNSTATTNGQIKNLIETSKFIVR